jgi:hypothetical protein
VAVCLTWEILSQSPQNHQSTGAEVLKRTFKAPGFASDMGPVGIVLSLSENIETGSIRFASYANATVFWRAWRNWAGTAPSDHKHRNQ